MPRRSSSFIGRFSQLLSFDMEETEPLPTEEELAAYKHARGIVKDCHIDSIFSDSKFLQAESLQQLLNSLIKAARKDEASAVFCLELLIAVTLNNRDRILLIWETVYEHISGIVQPTSTPCTLVEKAVFGVLKIFQRLLLPYKENLTDELLKPLQLVLKLDTRVADAYCEPITQEVAHLVKANASHVRSHVGWRTIISLLLITARHPEASDAGFEALRFIMSEGAHLSPSNCILWFAKLVCGLRSHEAERCESSGLIKGKVISLIINSPQNGHSLAIASSSSDRSCLAVKKICQAIQKYSK